MESRIASYSATVADQEDWCRDTPPAALSISVSLSFVSFRLRRFAAIYRASWGRKRRLHCAYREGSGGRLDSIVAEDWCHARFWAAVNVSDTEKHTWAGPKATAVTWQQCDNAGSAPKTDTDLLKGQRQHEADSSLLHSVAELSRTKGVGEPALL
jgi:hypothetical protein